MNLKNQLNYYLKRKGMTAAELSRKSGVSKQVLSLWLANSKPKKIEQIKSVADALGVTIDDLIFGNAFEKISDSNLGKELETLIGDEWMSGVFELKLRRVRK